MLHISPPPPFSWLVELWITEELSSPKSQGIMLLCENESSSKANKSRFYLVQVWKLIETNPRTPKVNDDPPSPSKGGLSSHPKEHYVEKESQDIHYLEALILRQKYASGERKWMKDRKTDTSEKGWEEEDPSPKSDTTSP